MDSKAQVFLGSDPLLAFQVEDKRLTEVHVRESPATVAYIPSQVAGFSQSSVNYTINMPGQHSSVLDRNIIESLAFTATFTVNVGAYDADTGNFTVDTTALSDAKIKTLVNALEICVRANPITSITSSAVLNIDGTQFTLPSGYNVTSVLNRFNNRATQKAGIQSFSSPMYDALSYSSDLVASASSPWCDFGNLDLSEDTVMPRMTGITSLSFAAGPANTASLVVTVNIQLVEAVCVPLLNTDEGAQKGIYGVRNIGLTRNFGALSRMLHIAFSSAATETAPAIYQISSLTVVPNMGSGAAKSGANLLCRFMTPQDVKTLPSVQRLRCPDIQVITTNPQTIPAPCDDVTLKMVTGDATNTFLFSSQSLGFVPSFLIFWVSYADQDFMAPQAVTTPDRLFPIKSVNITIGNKTNIVSAASIYDLYKLSLDSYMNCSFDQFIGSRFGKEFVTSGATGISLGARSSVNSFPLCIDISLLNLDPGMAVGLRTPCQLNASITYLNTGNDVVSATGPQCYAGTRSPRTSQSAQTWEYIPARCQGYMMVITPGMCTIADGVTTKVTGLYTQSELSVAQREDVFTRVDRKGSVVGNGFWDTIKSIGDVAVPLLGALGPVGGKARGLDARGLDARGLDARGEIGGRKMFY